MITINTTTHKGGGTDRQISYDACESRGRRTNIYMNVYLFFRPPPLAIVYNNIYRVSISYVEGGGRTK